MLSWSVPILGPKKTFKELMWWRKTIPNQNQNKIHTGCGRDVRLVVVDSISIERDKTVHVLFFFIRKDILYGSNCELYFVKLFYDCLDLVRNKFNNKVKFIDIFL